MHEPSADPAGNDRGCTLALLRAQRVTNCHQSCDGAISPPLSRDASPDDEGEGHRHFRAASERGATVADRQHDRNVDAESSRREQRSRPEVAVERRRCAPTDAPGRPRPAGAPTPTTHPERSRSASRLRATLVVALGIVTAAAATWLVSSHGDQNPSPQSLVPAADSPSTGTDGLGAPVPGTTHGAATAALDVPPEDRPVVGYGSAGDDVAALQELLTSLAFDPGPADGQFGPATASAVSAFQRSRGITADGIVGPEAWAALDEA
jgi:hypothetical protein